MEGVNIDLKSTTGYDISMVNCKMLETYFNLEGTTETSYFRASNCSITRAVAVHPFLVLRNPTNINHYITFNNCWLATGYLILTEDFLNTIDVGLDNCNGNPGTIDLGNNPDMNLKISNCEFKDTIGAGVLIFDARIIQIDNSHIDTQTLVRDAELFKASNTVFVIDVDMITGDNSIIVMMTNCYCDLNRYYMNMDEDTQLYLNQCYFDNRNNTVRSFINRNSPSSNRDYDFNLNACYFEDYLIEHRGAAWNLQCSDSYFVNSKFVAYDDINAIINISDCHIYMVNDDTDICSYFFQFQHDTNEHVADVQFNMSDCYGNFLFTSGTVGTWLAGGVVGFYSTVNDVSGNYTKGFIDIKGCQFKVNTQSNLFNGHEYTILGQTSDLNLGLTPSLLAGSIAISDCTIRNTTSSQTGMVIIAATLSLTIGNFTLINDNGVTEWTHALNITNCIQYGGETADIRVFIADQGAGNQAHHIRIDSCAAYLTGNAIASQISCSLAKPGNSATPWQHASIHIRNIHNYPIEIDGDERTVVTCENCWETYFDIAIYEQCQYHVSNSGNFRLAGGTHFINLTDAQVGVVPFSCSFSGSGLNVHFIGAGQYFINDGTAGSGNEIEGMFSGSIRRNGAGDVLGGGSQIQFLNVNAY